MNKLFIRLAIIGVIIFISCENNPGQDAEESPVVGEWSPVSWAYSEIVDREIVFQGTGALDSNRTFQSDGTGWEMMNFGYDGKNDWQTIYSFKWAFEHDKIYFTDIKFIQPEGIIFGSAMWSFETEWSVIDLTASEMKVEYTQESTDHDSNSHAHNVVTYQKVK